MTIENLNSRTHQSTQINNYMLTSHKPVSHSLTEGVYCRTYRPKKNRIGLESSLIHGEISKAIHRKPKVFDEDNSPDQSFSSKTFLIPLETKEHKSVNSEQLLINRLNSNIQPANFTNNIAPNSLFGVDTRSVVKYS